ncbi:hypothetical protein TNCV_3866821 [Trichonephila clavipes]|nr:hypothetical protein TNCV_3866821 [Trichonephila clavipes]
MQEIASRIKMEEAEKFYFIKGLKENRAIEMQLQSSQDIEELKEKKMEILDEQEKANSTRNEVIHPKYPVTRVPHYTNQLVHRQQYGRWNWRSDQSQHPVSRPCIRETNESRSNDQRFFNRMLQLSTPVKEPMKITRYSNHTEREN